MPDHQTDISPRAPVLPATEGEPTQIRPEDLPSLFAARPADAHKGTFGTVAIIVWRPQLSSLLAPSNMNVVVRRLPAPVMKYVAFTKRSPVPFP